MMRLIDILEEIQEKTGHNLPDRSVIRKINELQKKIFRNHLKVITISYLDLVSGLTEYPLIPPIGNVLKVLVNGVEYKYGRITERLGRCYFLLDKTLGIYPTPKDDVPQGITIFHYKAPIDLTESAMDASPDLDQDFHMLLVYGVAAEIDGSDKYMMQYQTMLQDMFDANQEPEPAQIQELPW